MVLAHIQLASSILSCMQHVDSWLGIGGPKDSTWTAKLVPAFSYGVSLIQYVSAWGLLLLVQVHVIMVTPLCHSGLAFQVPDQ
jgi:hypothetical protein